MNGGGGGFALRGGGEAAAMKRTSHCLWAAAGLHSPAFPEPWNAVNGSRKAAEPPTPRFSQRDIIMKYRPAS